MPSPETTIKKASKSSVVELEEQEVLINELEDDETVAEDLTETAIEGKYDSNQNQIFIQRNDFLIPNILQMVTNRDVLDLSPSYQRRTRWNDKKRSHLIESLLMNVPIPPIFCMSGTLLSTR
jgi:hypothetical protein